MSTVNFVWKFFWWNLINFEISNLLNIWNIIIGIITKREKNEFQFSENGFSNASSVVRFYVVLLRVKIKAFVETRKKFWWQKIIIILIIIIELHYCKTKTFVVSKRNRLKRSVFEHILTTAVIANKKNRTHKWHHYLLIYDGCRHYSWNTNNFWFSTTRMCACILKKKSVDITKTERFFFYSYILSKCDLAFQITPAFIDNTL